MPQRSSTPLEAELARREFLFRFVQELKAHGLDYDLGLTLLADFDGNTGAKASFYTLLLREPRLSETSLGFFQSPLTSDKLWPRDRAARFICFAGAKCPLTRMGSTAR